jgi:hypothetical protein
MVLRFVNMRDEAVSMSLQNVKQAKMLRKTCTIVVFIQIRKLNNLKVKKLNDALSAYYS